MKKDQIAFGIDIGGTNTKIGIFNTEGKLLSFRTLPTAKSEDPSHFIEQLAQEYQTVASTELASLATAFEEDYARAEAYFLLQIIQQP